MCLSRSTYYYEVSKEDIVAKRSEAVACVIREIFEHNKGRYGVRRVHHELTNRGYRVNHKKVQRLMHCMDLKGKRPKEKYHSYQGEVGKVADNLINRDFSTTKPLQKWTRAAVQEEGLAGAIPSKEQKRRQRQGSTMSLLRDQKV